VSPKKNNILITIIYWTICPLIKQNVRGKYYISILVSPIIVEKNPSLFQLIIYRRETYSPEYRLPAAMR
jgi:hypothetical protein